MTVLLLAARLLAVHALGVPGHWHRGAGALSAPPAAIQRWPRVSRCSRCLRLLLSLVRDGLVQSVAARAWQHEQAGDRLVGEDLLLDHAWRFCPGGRTGRRFMRTCTPLHLYSGWAGCGGSVIVRGGVQGERGRAAYMLGAAQLRGEARVPLRR